MRGVSLEALTESRLLRKESRPALEGFYYELSHDSLTGPVMKRRRVRDKAVKIALGLVTLLAVLGGIVANQTIMKYEQASQSSMDAYRESILEVLKRGAPLEPKMEKVPAGSFLMGDIQSGKGKQAVGASFHLPVHQVTIKPFQLGKYEVTFEEYDQFAAETGRRFPDDKGWGRGKRPVIDVSWEDAKDYAKWLSQKTSKHYRLPTESEWEYAARAGTRTIYWWGDEIGANRANCDGCGSQWDNKQTAPVGSFLPNKFGLHDTTGNVWEWGEDCWHENYKDAPGDGSAWLGANGGECGRRVVRGGSWNIAPVNLRSSFRFRFPTATRYTNSLGFRLVQDIP